MNRDILITRLANRTLSSNNATKSFCMVAPRATYCLPTQRGSFAASSPRVAFCIVATRNAIQK